MGCRTAFVQCPHCRGVLVKITGGYVCDAGGPRICGKLFGHAEVEQVERERGVAYARLPGSVVPSPMPVPTRTVLYFMGQEVEFE